MNQDAEYALLVRDAEEAFEDPTVIEPPLPPFTAARWYLRGYLTATDALLRSHERMELLKAHVFYGFVLESRTRAGTFAVVVRGTDGLAEWIEDAEGLQRAHPIAGLVEDGFFGIYLAMSFRPPGGTDAPLMGSLQRIIATGRATVIGHSLGAAVATYIALDLSHYLLNGRTSLRAIASPHPGNATFCDLVAFNIADHLSIAYEDDKVPKVPPTLPLLASYSALTKRQVLPSNPRVSRSGWCWHHALTYAWLLGGDEVLDAVGQVPYRDCIGPAGA